MYDGYSLFAYAKTFFFYTDDDFKFKVVLTHEGHLCQNSLLALLTAWKIMQICIKTFYDTAHIFLHSESFHHKKNALSTLMSTHNICFHE